MDYGEDPIGSRPAYRSKAEIQIARLLDRERIAFRYERPLAVIDRSKTRVWYPADSRADCGMIIVHLCMNDDPGYRKRTEHKMQVYRENGIEGVFLTEESFQGDWPARIVGQIEGILQGRLDRFYGSGRRAGGGRKSAGERAPFPRP